MDENADYRRQNEKALTKIRLKLAEIDMLKKDIDALALVV